LADLMIFCPLGPMNFNNSAVVEIKIIGLISIKIDDRDTT
jgi:hypothetical protein